MVTPFVEVAPFNKNMFYIFKKLALGGKGKKPITRDFHLVSLWYPTENKGANTKPPGCHEHADSVRLQRYSAPPCEHQASGIIPSTVFEGLH